MKRFFKAIANFIRTTGEFFDSANAYSIEHPASAMGLYRVF